ncbi:MULTISPECIES: hypothetical protein [Bacillaceae]|uniref:Uncharacterized protein n=1 Tax=Evansella alkalicola TaxID=745819 RepID=A0ABS6JTV3_9BACI|nr:MULTISPECIES: hypothetical protein [Bacillaceae]MBU9720570.1 hypothetical protein [Bacillus alkalicola]
MAVHQEPYDFIDIPAPQHGESSYYRVIFGDVDWYENQELKSAIYVLMGDEKGLKYRRVPHILTTPNTPDGLTDLDKVMAAVKKLRTRHYLI